MSNRVLIIGNSHVECLRGPAMELTAHDIEVLNLGTAAQKEDGNVDYEALRLSDPDLVVLCLAGNTHNVLALIEHPQPYSVGTIAAGSGRHFIPRQVLSSVLRSMLSGHMKRSRGLRARYSNAATVVMCPPPPVGNADEILRELVRKAPQHRGRFTAQLARGQNFGLPELRRAMYDLQSEIYRELAHDLGVILVTPPPRVLDAEGLLATDYSGRDPTHGNDAYGALMLERILAHMPEAA